MSNIMCNCNILINFTSLWQVELTESQKISFAFLSYNGKQTTIYVACISLFSKYERIPMHTYTPFKITAKYSLLQCSKVKNSFEKFQIVNAHLGSKFQALKLIVYRKQQIIISENFNNLFTFYLSLNSVNSDSYNLISVKSK